jgi:hypothetical protein
MDIFPQYFATPLDNIAPIKHLDLIVVQVSNGRKSSDGISLLQQRLPHGLAILRPRTR